VVAGVNGRGVRLDLSPVSLRYDAFSGFQPNIKRNQGTVLFWLKPEWSSGARVLLEMSGAPGFPSSWWLTAAPLTPAGAQFQLVAVDDTQIGSVLTANASTTFHFSGWHRIAVTYSRQSSAIYVDGSLVGSVGTGVRHYPRKITSFYVGSSASSLLHAQGVFDELTTFNHPLTASEILSDYQSFASWLNLDSDGDGLTNLAESQKGTDSDDPDTDSDGVPDGLDAFPLDPNRSELEPVPNPSDTTPPVIQLLQPKNATLVP